VEAVTGQQYIRACALRFYMGIAWVVPDGLPIETVTRRDGFHAVPVLHLILSIADWAAFFLINRISTWHGCSSLSAVNVEKSGGARRV
jgi:hypothetical protein